MVGFFGLGGGGEGRGRRGRDGGGLDRVERWGGIAKMDVEEEEIKERRELGLAIVVMMVDCAKNMVERCQGGRRAESGARTVSRPKLIVPTNLQMAIVGNGIVNVEGIIRGSSWNGWRGARLEMLQSIGDAVCSRKKLWCC